MVKQSKLTSLANFDLFNANNKIAKKGCSIIIAKKFTAGLIKISKVGTRNPHPLKNSEKLI